jgi:hypothetical protein
MTGDAFSRPIVRHSSERKETLDTQCTLGIKKRRLLHNDMTGCHVLASHSFSHYHLRYDLLSCHSIDEAVRLCTTKQNILAVDDSSLDRCRLLFD